MLIVRPGNKLVRKRDTEREREREREKVGWSALALPASFGLLTREEKITYMRITRCAAELRGADRLGATTDRRILG